MIDGRSPDAILDSLLKTPLPEIPEEFQDDLDDIFPIEEPAPFITPHTSTPQLNSLGLW